MKMLFIFYALLMLKFGCCTKNYTFETKTAAVGQNVTLMCPLVKNVLYQETFYWIRLVSGNWLEFVGARFNFEHDGLTKFPHIQVKQEEETFLLQINGAKQSDTGLYYCVKTKQLEIMFLTGTMLKIKGPDPDITAVIQKSSSDPISPGDPETLQCSVLSDSEKKTCSEDHRVSWFRAGSDESHPSLIYAHGNSGEECGVSPEADSVKKCVYKFSKTVSSSDTGTYYCAVATCGQILFGKGAKLDNQESNLWDLSKIFLILLSVALTVSLAVISYLIYTIKRKSCHCCNDAARGSVNQQHKQKDEHPLVYSAPTFSKRKSGKPERRNEKSPQEDTVYTDVKTFWKD
ncbi:uncharacterized protein LOC108231290 isoform X2 [Kryptolebias marmoratus]|uniref:uncharacterized protein LOC108231290 isoform X2 n=1 Tax=Kryptolebias marmoratus TaxID=37003 RepID=UPI000D52F297|nr:uncharacterized protein LOC108231290 isoform X2 [Kryptolebias marmoratus]